MGPRPEQPIIPPPIIAARIETERGHALLFRKRGERESAFISRAEDFARRVAGAANIIWFEQVTP